MQKINLKKTTKEQMLNMLEKAWNANAGAADDIAALSQRIDKQNDALAKCVAEKNELRRECVNVETMTNQRNAAIAENKDLRTKLADTEAALVRANSEMAVLRHDLTCEQESSVHLASVCRWRSDHPWRNLWAWVFQPTRPLRGATAKVYKSLCTFLR